MTVTVNLPDELQRRLEEMAQERKSSVASVALEILRASLETNPTDTWSSEAVRETAKRVIEEDRELLLRLAQ
jgi:predicted transcriptional regulator